MKYNSDHPNHVQGVSAGIFFGYQRWTKTPHCNFGGAARRKFFHKLIKHLNEQQQENIWNGYTYSIINKEAGEAIKYRHFIKMSTRIFGNAGRDPLQINLENRVKGINNIFFIKHEEMTKYMKARYEWIVVKFWMKKYDPY